MSLQDYNYMGDEFKLDANHEADKTFMFPCCCCVNRYSSVKEDPCKRCGDNKEDYQKKLDNAPRLL